MHYTRVYYWVSSWWANRIGLASLNNIYASYSTLGGATYLNAFRSSIKIIQGQESGAQTVQSSDGSKIKSKEILLFTFI